MRTARDPENEVIHIAGSEEDCTECGLLMEGEWEHGTLLVSSIEVFSMFTHPSNNLRFCQGCAERVYLRTTQGLDPGPLVR